MSYGVWEKRKKKGWEGILMIKLDHTRMEIGRGTIKFRQSTTPWSS